MLGSLPLPADREAERVLEREVSGHLRATMENAARSISRQRPSFAMVEDGLDLSDVASGDVPIPSRAEEREMVRFVDSEIRRLSVPNGTIVDLVARRSLSFAEVSMMVNLSAKAVKSRYHRSLETIRRAWREQDPRAAEAADEKKGRDP